MTTTTPSRTQDLMAQRIQHVARGVGTAHPIVAARASGARLWDIEGREYIDFIGGIGVMNVGHSHPRVVEAVKAQVEQITHAAFQVTMYESYIQLAAKLNSVFPGEGPAKSILFTSGAEAVENSIKIARAATNRAAVISFTHSFHGRTLMGMSLTGKSRPYKQNFGPFAPEIYHAPYPYAYHGWTTEKALASLRELFETEIAPERVAAIIIEPVLGEGGFVAAPTDFLQTLREITTQYGIMLIADEIQCGFGRTGHHYAIEHSGVKPDMVVFAKSVAGGLPLSGVTGRSDVMDAPEPGGLGGTYAGNPIACAAALAVFDIMEEENLLVRSEQIGQRLMSAFQDLQKQHSIIGDVRGLGGMIGVEFVLDHETHAPAVAQVNRIVEIARENGLLLLKAGMYGNVIRVLVPLVATDQDLDEAISIFQAACTEALA
jgi:4-aminobutyrate aminotransferase / (S)-3-amino-2-methylpropionate transaminase / 5-aminovalerate transaminase